MPSYYDTRSRLCKVCRRARPCPGSGPAPCPILFLGEGPGDLEDRLRIPFVGNSGQELDHTYLPLAGLMRPAVYTTNAIKCRQGKRNGDDPDPAEVLACALHHLPGELARVQPSLIVTLGATALRLFGPHSLDLHHGRPIPNQHFAQWSGTIFPVYHPAAGLRKSEYLINLASDFRDLRRYLHGTLTLPVDAYPSPDYRALHTPDDFAQVLYSTPQLQSGLHGVEIAIDTETIEGRIWCLTFSLTPGTGYLIRADNSALLHKFRAFLASVRPLVLFHNYLFDCPVLAQVGIVAPRWLDTMQEAYQVCHLPQSLKALAYRLCGMEMQEYEDLVLPYAIDRAVGYLDLGSKTRVEGYVESLPWRHKKLRCSGGKAYGGKHGSTEVEFHEPGTQPCPVCGKPKGSGNMERDRGGRTYIWDRARAVLMDTVEAGANPLKRWAAIPKEERAVLEAVIGEMPRPSIEQVPYEEAVGYAARDADATIRVKPLVRGMAAELGRRVR